MEIKFVICVILFFVAAALAVPIAQPGIGAGTIGGVSGGLHGTPGDIDD